MDRSLRVLSSLGLLVSLFLAACGVQPTSSSAPSQPQREVIEVVITATSRPTADAVRIMSTRLNVRAGPHFEEERLLDVGAGEEFFVLDEYAPTGWLAILLPDGGFGWISGSENYVRRLNVVLTPTEAAQLELGRESYRDGRLTTLRTPDPALAEVAPTDTPRPAPTHTPRPAPTRTIRASATPRPKPPTAVPTLTNQQKADFMMNNIAQYATSSNYDPAYAFGPYTRDIVLEYGEGIFAEVTGTFGRGETPILVASGMAIFLSEIGSYNGLMPAWIETRTHIDGTYISIYLDGRLIPGVASRQVHPYDAFVVYLDDTPMSINEAWDIINATNSYCDCSGNIFDCRDFTSPQAAQTCFIACYIERGFDVHLLDQDNDGLACEMGTQ